MILSEAIDRIDSAIVNLQATGKDAPITTCNDLVDGVISVLSGGMYPGLSPWCIFKLLQRLEGLDLSLPLTKRLRFAPKTVTVITSSLADQSDNAKARAFVRCMLNTGHLTATIELLSCIGTWGRICSLELDGENATVHDLWSYLLSNGEDNTEPALKQPTVNKLLQPFISDGVNILRALQGDALERQFRRFLTLIRQVGGPYLSTFLEKSAVNPDLSMFCLPLQVVDGQDEGFANVYPSDSCLGGLESPTAVTDDTMATAPKKKTIIKKVVVKKRVVKGDASFASPFSPVDAKGEVREPSSPVTTIHQDKESKENSNGETEFDPTIKAGSAFTDVVNALSLAITSSHELISAADSFVVNSTVTPSSVVEPSRVPVSDFSWVQELTATITTVPLQIKGDLELSIEKEAAHLNGILSES